MIFQVINIFISTIFFIYCFFLLKYITTKFLKKKRNSKLSLVYWIDYCFIIFCLFIISIIYTINLFLKEGNKNGHNILFFNYDQFFPLLFESNFIIDVIIAFQLLVKIKKMKINKHIYHSNIKMNKYIQKVDIMNHYKKLSHLIVLLIAYVMNVIIIVISDYIIQKRNKNIFINIFQIFLFLFSFIIMLILSNRNKSLIGNLIFFENNVVEKLYNNNKTKLIASSEHLLTKYLFDLILNSPCIIKICFNTFSDFFKYVYYYAIIFSGFLYLFFFGTMLLSIDSTNFTLLPCTLKFLFCTKQFSFYFGDGKKIITKIFEPDDIDIFNYNIYFNKSKLFTSQEDFINKLNGINGYSETTISSLFEENQSINEFTEDNSFTKYNTIENIEQSQTRKIDEKIKEMEKQKIKNEKEYGPCNFFIMFKLIYLYFSSNIEIYKKRKKSAEDNGFFADCSIYKNKQLPKMYGKYSISHCSSGRKISLANIKDKINSLNKSLYEQLSAFKIFNINEVMGNIQEYHMKTLFLKYLSKNLDKNYDFKKNNNAIKIIENDNDNEPENKMLLPSELLNDNIKTNNNINSNLNMNSIYFNNTNQDSSFYEFKIESLMNSILLDLFPFYEIDINDILNSLDICQNMNLFDTFFRKKNDDKNFNSYYTYDSFLSLEVYDKNFLPYEQLKLFMTNYRNYFLDKISNFGFSFLPLIIGIFNISYLSYNKIVILLKNPLAFIPDVPFNYWLKFIFSEDSEKVENSSGNNEIADFNEIEVKNNITLNKEEYLDTMNILEDDIKFLNNSSFNMDFKLNIFLLNNINKINNSYEENIINNQEQNNINNINNTTENANLMNIIRNTDLFPGSNAYEPYSFKKKFYGSESISILEHICINELIDSNNILKIYFSEILKKKNILKKQPNVNSDNNIFIINEEQRNSQGISNTNTIVSISPIDSEIQENNQKLCKIIKNKILKKIGKAENCFFEENLNVN